jgi:vacuolar-type H+-ATPase subunit F/Vma7
MPHGRKIVVIGGEDAVFGLGLIGLEGRVVSSLEAARQAIRESSADADVALILLTEDWSEARLAAQSDARPDVFEDSGAPIVEIPCPGPPRTSTSLGARIEQALGVRLEHEWPRS